MVISEALPPAKPTERFAGMVFRELQQSILQCEAGALTGDIEAVHDMRVGVRRLRVALSNFTACLPKADRQRLRKTLEHLAGALGEVRDLDVMIDALRSKQAGKAAEDQAMIGSFIRRLRSRRRRRHRQLVVYLRGEEYQTFKREFSPEEDSVLVGGELQNEQAA